MTPKRPRDPNQFSVSLIRIMSSKERHPCKPIRVADDDRNPIKPLSHDPRCGGLRFRAATDERYRFARKAGDRARPPTDHVHRHQRLRA